MPTADRIRAWLDAAPNAERTGDYRAIRPERMRAFLVHLPAPPAPLTVAGTKGKGSTVRLIEAALRGGGLPTVAFSSPHLVSVLERWRVDGREADPITLWPLCVEVQRIEDATGVRLSWFERTFAVAVLLAAARPGCALVNEVGLGGRLDATNALDAAVAVLTQVSHDHREVLGPTVWHIAAEKLAIARPGRPLVIAPQPPASALAVWHRLPRDVDARWAVRHAEPFALALVGDHQQDNAATAVLAASLYRPGLDVGAARAAMAVATLPGRCQLMAVGGRALLIDGAHNADSLAATLAVARQRLARDFVLILGTAADKELEAMLAQIPPGTRVRRCGFASPRARGPEAWPAPAQAWPWHATVAEALAAVPGDACVSGSLYLAGEALSALSQQGEQGDLALQR